MYNNILFLLFLFLLTLIMGNTDSVSEPQPVSGELRKISTHLGEMMVRIVGNLDKDYIPVVCLPGANAALFDEWVNVIQPISEKSYVFCIINFHSNANTKPGVIFGGIQPPDVSKIINEAILQEVFKKDKCVIMGKSWGGYMAVAHTSTHPSKVIKLVIQAPAFSTKERILALQATNVPTFLAWALDDSIMWYSRYMPLWKEVMGSNIETYTAEIGGHSLIQEYTTPILCFLQK